MTLAWSPLPIFMLRRTGFPFELLEALRMPDAAGFAAAVETSDDILASLVEELRQHLRRTEPGSLERSRAAAARAAAQKQERVVGDGAAGPELAEWSRRWNEALERRAAATEQLGFALEREEGAVRSALTGLLDDPRFVEAVRQSNPAMEVAVASYRHHAAEKPHSAKTRQLERRFYAYAQRFAAKNETTSFFGPLDFGRFEAGASEPFVFERSCTGTLGRRVVRMAHWAVEAVADRIAADPEARSRLVPRLTDGWSLTLSGELIAVVSGRRVALPDPARRAIEALDGCSGLDQVRGVLSPAERDALEDLIKRGVVRLEIGVPTAAPDPLACLFKTVSGWPEGAARERWIASLGQLRTAVEAEDGDSAERLAAVERAFSSLTDTPARRRHGEVYADRSVLFEECRGDVRRCTIGPPLLGAILRALDPPLRLAAGYSRLTAEACRLAGREVHAELGGGSVPFLRFVTELDRSHPLEECLRATPVETFVADLRRRVEAAEEKGIAVLATDDLDGLLEAPPAGALASPDVFLEAESVDAIKQGRCSIVLGELHHGAQVNSSLLFLHPDFPAARREIAEALGGGEANAHLVYRRTQGKAFELELPNRPVELLGRTSLPAARAVRAEDLEVAQDADGEVCLQTRERVPLRLHARDPRATSNWLFGTPPMVMPPVEMRRRPRIQLGEAVVWRRCWRLGPEEVLPAESARDHEPFLRHAARLRSAHGLPARCFARVAAERKPILVDFASPLSLDLLFSAVRKETGEVVLTEMLPGPESWWLRDSSGTYGSELRCTLVNPK